MSDAFDMLVYLDEILVKNLASLVLTGFIETTTLTQAFDSCLTAGMREGGRNETNCVDSYSKIEREGFKDKNKTESCNDSSDNHHDRQFEGKRCVREERKIQTTYTTFVLNNNLISYFNKNNKLNHKDVDDIENDKINVGDIIELEGTITNESLISYVNTMINLLDVFGCDHLDKLIKGNKGCMNFTHFHKMLLYLQSVLTCNNTTDLIMKAGQGYAVITVSVDNFVNTHCHAFDKINCPCKVIGKVVKTCNSSQESISLLRKTGQEEFYESFFKNSEELIKILKNNKIFIPKCPKLRFNEHAIQIMPLNMYM